MKNSTPRRDRTLTLENARWGAYVTAGAATALTAIGSAEAEIHYSGVINQQVKGTPDHSARVSFQLDQPGDSFVLHHLLSSSGAYGYAGVSMRGVGARARFGGFVHSVPYYGGPVSYASKLRSGENVATEPRVFLQGGRDVFGANMAVAALPRRRFYKWNERATGFLALQFDGGNGLQYGWARVKMSGPPVNSMTLVDYAWGDPGDTIVAGDTGEGAPSNAVVLGSLGSLALGGAGLLASQQARGIRWAKN